ncbi:MAG: hypothetical protein IPH57_05365 [Saprospiraceae bacterium]|nr:hypothetical protein [Saprospiraceae bacterium]
MKFIRFFIFAIVLLNFSCGKEVDPVVEEEVLVPVFQMEIDGKKWEARDFYYKIDNGVPRIFGSDNIYTLHWEIDGALKMKSYTLGKSENELITSFYLFSGGKTYVYLISSGTLKIDKFDTVNKILTGTYSFTAQFEGKDLKVTNGKFVIKNF